MSRTFKVYLNTLRQKGYLAYEYNPFHNYQTDVDLYEINTNVGKVLVPKGYAVNVLNGRLVKEVPGKEGEWQYDDGTIIKEENGNISEINANTEMIATEGSLIDLDTQKLNFDLEHPVDITVLPSYDGSVNLILNDNKNIPRLINSRFSVREKGTYEIVDRIGENDTNVYNSKNFDKDTSLYFLYERNPIVQYVGHIKGNLLVGLYCFYFAYCDADNNESDFIAETGLIPAFIGSDKDPYSIDGGIKNQSSNKGIKLKLSNLDKSYNYLKIYYVRYFADYLQNRVCECKKLFKRFPINSDIMFLQVTGYEEAEDLDPNILNISRFNPKSVLAQAQCKNILFFGNIVKNTDNVKELTDCALRITPHLEKNDKFYTLTTDYDTIQNNFGYYDSSNIYNNVGYFNKEYYRFGVVFIYENGTLSNVYNTLGCDLTKDLDITVDKPLYSDASEGEGETEETPYLLKRNYIGIDDFGWIDNSSGIYKEGTFLNAKGVCRIDYEDSYDNNTIFGIKFNIPEEVVKFLKEDLGIRGLFFVRQKCIPNILAQCYLLPMDEQMEGPVLEIKEKDNNKLVSKYYTESFVTLSLKIPKDVYVLGIKKTIEIESGGGLITNDYNSRLYEYIHSTSDDSENSISTQAYAAICPDFLLNLPYYNQIFNGSKFKLEKISTKATDEDEQEWALERQGRIYKSKGEKIQESKHYTNVSICTVTEDVPTVAIKDKIYRLEMGETEEAFRFEYAEVNSGTYEAGKDEDFEKVSSSTNIVRGKFSPYLAIYSNSKLKTSCLYNIYLESTMNMQLEYQTRMDSSEPFYAISNRYNFEGLSITAKGTSSSNIYSSVCWRGDCFINTFTYRLNRNFNDPSLPNNDKIIDINTWKDNYKADKPEDWTNISRSDINAVQMGSWITFKVRSAMNYALRSQDHSFVSEEALMGAPRSYYPRNQLMWRGENKMPDSYLYNDAYRASLGYKCYFALPDVNYIKNTFSNRILYSAVSIQDSFKNNYRYSLSTYFRDYSQEYGSIQRLVGFEGHILVVFEHGIGLAVINERVLSGTGDGEPVFINTNNVLPEELTIITDTHGTQWPESVIKTETGSVYGVDTITKKIWRVKGQLFEILSDFKVGKFLIDNITLGEREKTPFIGLKNVKSHYNNNKKDIMFTFYDDVYKDEEKVWNLCYNELLDLFVTFYSWLPSYSENIDTQFFSFDRNTSKWLSLLYKTNYNIPENTGVLVLNPILSSDTSSSLGTSIYLGYRNEHPYGSVYLTILNPDGTTVLKLIKTDSQTTELTTTFKFKVEKDHWRNYNLIKNFGTGIFTGMMQLSFPSQEFLTLYNNFKNNNITSINDWYEKIRRNLATSHGSTPPDNAQYLRTVYRAKTLLWNYISNNYGIDLESVFKLNYDSRYMNFIGFDYDAWKEEEIVFSEQTGDTEWHSGCFSTEFYNWITKKGAAELELLFRGGILTFEITPILNSMIGESTTEDTYGKTLTIVIASKKIFEQSLKEEDKLLPSLTTDFYLHGQAGLFNITENTYPCHWYGKYHPFEFEFIVNDKVGQLKIFTDLIMISNKAEPESFHFEIEGDNYEFSSDKRAMYFRLEATKNLYLNLGSDILYDRYFTDVAANPYTYEQHYRAKSPSYSNYTTNGRFNWDKAYPVQLSGLLQQVKSTIFPLYYERVDTYDKIYHDYWDMKGNGYDFKNLSGSEVIWNRDLNQFNIVTHIKNSPIDHYGRLRGNSRYKEGKWNILIPSISFMLKNEENWKSLKDTPSYSYKDLLQEFGSPLKNSSLNIPPIVLNSLYIPKDITSGSITVDKLPNIYSIILKNNKDEGYLRKVIDLSNWTYRKEARIRDKWMKVRVRYSGRNLAIIHSLITLYNISYS